ncbi:MAG: hypothetical protein Q4F11_00175 [Eubacteriales bacterium]|nr:hypothetical protein [Eubacteriales bacterium]
MELNGVNSGYAAYEAAVTGKSAETKYDADNKNINTSKKPAYSEEAATYEKSSISGYASNSKADRTAIAAQLKADADNRMKQMQSLVTQMFEKQGITIGNADDMWKVLASGNFKADAETIAQAKEDISENGYWGVAQTSDRIFSFATALAGDDPEQMKKMQAAVEKGFKEATKSWGRKLPEISSQTYDAVMKKFDDYYASKETKTEE